jgi:nicotinate-nucleotide adenylyltransferase
LGILGGTFDPVHNAHLAMARAALHDLQLQQILWMPTGRPGYRQPPVASAEHRVAMLHIATEGEPSYAIDARELAASATGYTVDTLRELRAELGEQATLYLLMGADQYSRLASWHRPEELKRLAHVAVFARPGYPPPDGNARAIPMPQSRVSSSDIRARVARGADIAGLVPPAVANYIRHHGLYS